MDWLDALIAAPTPPGADALLEAGRPIVIYGAGRAGTRLRATLLERGARVRHFLDAEASTCAPRCDLPVYLPAEDPLTAEERREAVGVVAIYNPTVDVPALMVDLHQLGYGTVLNFIAAHSALADALGDWYSLSARHTYADASGEIRRAHSLMADATSRLLFRRLLEFRLTGDYHLLPAPDSEHQYCPPDLPRWQNPVRFVDGGAYRGETLGALFAHGYQVDAVAAFEPDPASFAVLSEFVLRRAEPGVTHYALWPCAIYSSAQRLSFRAGQEEASALGDGGSCMVHAVTLDVALKSFDPTLIKLDLEGAEYEALLGARCTIAESRPGLAVCVYHRPEHLWQVPLLIDGWDCGYRLHLRLHAHSGFEAVLYAVPSAT